MEGPVFVIVVSLAALFLVTQGISPPKANAASIRPELPIAYLKTPQCEGQGHVCLGQHKQCHFSCFLPEQYGTLYYVTVRWP